jgi:hypothetical protein
MLVAVFTILWAMTGLSYAQSGGFAEARLLSKSSSGKTALFNIGDLDLVKAGDFGVILRRVAGQQDNQIRVIPVAKGRVIKTGKTTSLWYLYEVDDTVQLIMRDSYIVTTETITMRGRKLLGSQRLTIVSPQSEVNKNILSKREGDKDLLSLKKDKYLAYRSAHASGEKWAKDGELIDMDGWVNIDEKGERQFAKSLWRSPSEKDFAEQKRLETFEKMVTTYLQKINDPAFDYNKFYSSQVKDSTGGYRMSVVNQTEYQAFLENEQEKMQQDARLYRRLLEKGQAWSEDFSDEELAEVINKVGISYEQERRRNIQATRYNWMFMGSFGVNLLDNENRVDQANATAAKWSVEVGGELFIAPRHDSLQRISFVGSMRNARDGISVGDLNARIDEYSFAGGIFWHPFQSPFVVGQNIVFVGLGTRTGIMRLSTPSNGDQANYTILSLPTLHAGIKYTFKSGVGLRLSGQLENVSLEKIENNSPEVQLPSRAEFIDGRLNIGLTKLF